MSVRPEIILGPPGTGKTTTLLGLVDEELARGTPPDRIGFVTFTKKAAREALERAVKRFSIDRRDLRFFRTLHSLCFQTLGMTSGDVMEGKRVVEFGRWLGIELSESVSMDEGSAFGYQPGDRALFLENLARVRCVSLEEQYREASDLVPWSLVERVSRGLQQYKKDNHLVDYTDMLRMFVDLSRPPRLDVLFVDEDQDLSRLQWMVVAKLAERCRRVVLAGDDDQAIYRWAGADIEHFLRMEGDVRVLGQSWRVPRSIQQISSGVIGRVKNRREKEWAARDEDGEVVRVGAISEVDYSGESVLVLARNVFLMRDRVMPLMRQLGLIYDWKGNTSVKRSILEAILVWERLRRGELVTVEDALKTYEYMSSGAGVKRGYKSLPGLNPEQEVTLSDLRARGGLLRDEIWHEALDRISADERAYMLRALRQGESLRRDPRVHLSTIHGAKGGEADHVVLLRDMAPRSFNEMQAAREDEARVWYVAVTRARKKLTIVGPRSRYQYEVESRAAENA